LERKRDQAGLEAISNAAAFLDLLAIAVPPLAPVAGGVGLAIIVANAIQQIADTPAATQRTDALTVSSLLSGDFTSYFQLVTSRPTMISVCQTLVINNIAMITAFGAIEKRAPRLALKLRILMDLDSLMEPSIKELLTPLLQESSKGDKAQ
jgi:hypothetical protein